MLFIFTFFLTNIFTCYMLFVFPHVSNAIWYHTYTKKGLLHYCKLLSVWEYVSVQFSPVTQSCPTLCNPMDCSTLGLPVHHQLPEFTQTCFHGVGDAIQPSHPLSSSSPPTFNHSQHQGLFKWVSSSHQVAKVLEF